MSDSTLPVGLGQRPKASPPARTWTVILGIVLIAGAAVAGREAWVVGADEGGQSGCNRSLMSCQSQTSRRGC